MTEIKNYNAETKELNHPRIKSDHQDLQALTNIINSTINPLLPMVNQNSLFNLKTGKQASKATEAHLLTVLEEEIPREIHLWKNVRKGVIGLKNLLKRVKFQSLQLQIFLKRINPPKLQKFKGQKEHMIDSVDYCF